MLLKRDVIRKINSNVGYEYLSSKSEIETLHSNIKFALFLIFTLK